MQDSEQGSVSCTCRWRLCSRTAEPSLSSQPAGRLQLPRAPCVPGMAHFSKNSTGSMLLCYCLCSAAQPGPSKGLGAHPSGICVSCCCRRLSKTFLVYVLWFLSFFGESAVF